MTLPKGEQTMSKFTSVPWEVVANTKNGGCEVGTPNEEPIADVYNAQDGELIAAAPDLYEALEELMEIVEGIRVGDYTPDSFTCQPARFALSKAGWTGGDAE